MFRVQSSTEDWGGVRSRIMNPVSDQVLARGFSRYAGDVRNYSVALGISAVGLCSAYFVLPV